MPKRARNKYHEFLVKAKTKAQDNTEHRMLHDLMYALRWFKMKVFNVEIQELLLLRNTNVDIKDCHIYIKLNEKKLPVGLQYFSKLASNGYNMFELNNFHVESSSIQHCQTTFINLLDLEQWYQPAADNFQDSELQTPQWVPNRLKDLRLQIDYNAIDDVQMEYKRDRIKEEFSEMLRQGQVNSFQ